VTFNEQFYLPGVLFLVTIGFGFWVSHLGKPYHPVLFNLHKLIALGGVVLVILRIIKVDLVAASGNPGVGLLAAAAVGVIVLFATGAVMSIRQEVPRSLLRIHQTALVLVVISATWLVSMFG
jgi:hypothetical protein